MAESKIRMVKSGKSFTMIQNTVLRDKSLSLKAKGLYAVMMSLPDDWEYTVSGLAAICGIGRDAIRSTLKDMETAGYLERRQTRPEAGQFGGCEYVVYETPAGLRENPSTDNPSTGKPSSDKPLTENPTQYNKDLINNTPLPPKGEGEGSEKRHRSESKYQLAPEAATRIDAYCAGDPELAQRLAAMVDQRIKLRAINSDTAIKLMLSQLDKLSGRNRGKKLAIIDQSLVNSWKTFYPLREEKNTWGATVPNGTEGGMRLGKR